MTWLWIMLRYLFPADPIRQGAQAMRHRVQQLIHISQDKAQLAELLCSPELRLHLELLILDAEDCLRLWIAMRAHQIAKIRPKAPRRRATPNLTYAKDLFHLLARIAALAADCDAMEQRAQAHAARLKQMSDADPLAAYGSAQHANDAARHAAANDEAVEFAKAGLGLILRDRGAIVSKDDAVLTARATSRAPPYSIAGANP